MSIALITGSGGLVGGESVARFYQEGFEVWGIDNNMRQVLFGESASVMKRLEQLQKQYPKYKHFDMDIRDKSAMFKLLKENGKDISVIIHTAAQPSHDWAASDPFTDFELNAGATLTLLEGVRQFCPHAVFIFMSTNKVYGDLSNSLPIIEEETRWELASSHPFHAYGIDESFSIDQSKHSLFGASKLSADVIVQEYGRYFGIKTVCFRGGCITGPAHCGVPLHGFLSYLVKSGMNEIPYTVFGYKGKQVRDNIHAYDLVEAFWQFFLAPRVAEVYNIGGSRHSHASLMECVALFNQLSGKQMNLIASGDARSGDHIWWVSDVRRFQTHFPEWRYKYTLTSIMEELIEAERAL